MVDHESLDFLDPAGRKAQVVLRVTGLDIGVTADGDGMTVLIEPLDEIDKLGGFLVGDDIGIKLEESIELLEAVRIGIDDHRLFDHRFGFLLNGLFSALGLFLGLQRRGGCLSGGEVGEILGGRTVRLAAEHELQTGQRVVLIIRIPGLLGVETVAEHVAVDLKVEGEAIGQADVSTQAIPESRRDHLFIPQILEIRGRNGFDILGAILESEDSGAAHKGIRAEDTLVVIAEQIREVERQVGL